MDLQRALVIAAASLALLYFIRGAIKDLAAPGGGSCGKCSSGGCPAARKG